MNLEEFKVKYHPMDIFEILAIDNKDRHILIDFIERFRSGNFPKYRGVLLVGPPGTGKTETAYTLARQFNMSVFEVNASDIRDADRLSYMLDYSFDSEQIGNPIIVLLDEIDGMIRGNKESSGMKYITNVLKTSRIPIIFTANDDRTVKKYFKSIIKIEYKLINQNLLRKFIKHVSIEENLHLSDVDIMRIASASQGDMRKVFSLVFLPIDVGIEKMIDENSNVFTLMNLLYGSSSPKQCIDMYYNSDIRSLSNFYIWLCESVPSYNSSSLFLEKAYSILSKYGPIVDKSNTLGNWYLQKYLVKAIIYDMKALIGSGFERYRKYPTPFEFLMSSKLKENRKIMEHLKLCFYNNDMSLNTFKSNFWTIRELFNVDRKFIVSMIVRVYRYSLLVHDDINKEKELFCKMCSMIKCGDIRMADEYKEMFDTLDDDDSHRFIVQMTKRNPYTVKKRKRHVVKKMKEETDENEREFNLDDLGDISIADLV